MNNGYQQGPVGYNPEYEQRRFDANGACNAYTTYKDSATDWPTQNRTRHGLGAQLHEPRGRILSTAQNILLAFFGTNRFPTLKEKESLAHVTKLTTSQVNNWFNNTRYREVPPSASSLSTFPVQDLRYSEQYQGQYAHRSGCSGSGYTLINTDASSILTCLPGPHRSVGEHGRQSPSLEAYQDTPPRDDAPPVIVSESVIGFLSNRALPPIVEDATPMGRTAGSSGSWVNVPQGVDSQSHSMSRESTQISSASSPNRMGGGSRSGRQGKRRVYNVQALPRERTDSSKPYQCIRCYKPFATSSDMRRHIETQHDPQKQWICMREGLPGLRVLDDLSQPICILCHFPDPGEDHFHNSHNVLPCIEKHPSHSFDRRDQLSGHITRRHDKEGLGLAGLSDVLEQWESPLYGPGREPSRYCGFCQKDQVGWQKFINHIAKHYSAGCDMTQWDASSAHHH